MSHILKARMKLTTSRKSLDSPTLSTIRELHHRNLGASSLAEPTPLDKAKIEEAFRLMGQYLLDRKALGEIAVYGGSAILLQFEWRLLSEDVDARVISAGNHGLVLDAAHYAASQLGLATSWLNESVAMYVRRGEAEGDRVFVGLYPSFERFGLRVTAANPEYMLAMKLNALERTTADDRDFKDAIHLGIACEVKSVEGLRNIFKKYFADEELSLSANLRLREVAVAIQHEAASRK
jgi:hypothetical protein